MRIFTDKLKLNRTRQVDQNGFVHVKAVITAVGVQRYSRGALGLTDRSEEMVGVFRPPETVFHPETIESFKNVPVVDNHPQTADGLLKPETTSYRKGGHVGEDVEKLGETTLGGTIHLQDGDFIDKSQKSQTSAAYLSDIEERAGEYEGQKYDFTFVGPMIGNHLALVSAARCGPDCRVLDKKENAMEEKEIKALVQQSVTDAMKGVSSTLATQIKQTLTDHQEELEKKATKAAAEKAEADKTKQAHADEVEKAKKDAVKSHELRANLKTVLGDKFEDSKTDKELLGMAFGDRVEDVDSKSVDYLTALLDSEVETRRKAGKNFVDHSGDDTSPDGLVVKAI